MPNAEHELDRHGSNRQSEMPRELYDPDYPEGDPEEAAKAKIKNEDLVRQLTAARSEFCGIGTNKVKRRLNRIAVRDPDAMYVRKLLEIEDTNIRAKQCSKYRYKNKIYGTKEYLLKELVAFCIEHNYVHGMQETDNFSTSKVLYFDLPDGTQVSFHCNDARARPYKGTWDGLVNSTLPKLEKYIRQHYGKELDVH